LHAIIDHFHFVITHHPCQSKPIKNQEKTKKTQSNKERNSVKKRDFYSFIKSISLRLLGEDIFAFFFYSSSSSSSSCFVEREERRSF
jgi:hypothetical protein